MSVVSTVQNNVNNVNINNPIGSQAVSTGIGADGTSQAITNIAQTQFTFPANISGISPILINRKVSRSLLPGWSVIRPRTQQRPFGTRWVRSSETGDLVRGTFSDVSLRGVPHREFGLHWPGRFYTGLLRGAGSRKNLGVLYSGQNFGGSRNGEGSFGFRTFGAGVKSGSNKKAVSKVSGGLSLSAGAPVGVLVGAFLRGPPQHLGVVPHTGVGWCPPRPVFGGSNTEAVFGPQSGVGVAEHFFLEGR